MRFARHILAWPIAVCLVAAGPALVLAQQPPPAAGDESALIAVLQSDAPLFDKAKACQRLATVGTKNAVPVLAKLLAVEELSHYARYGLEPIPDPSVDDVLRETMGKLEGRLLIGVINSIGNRRDVKAVDELKKRLGSSDLEVSAAAAAALGRIGSPDALKILQRSLHGRAESRPAVADACLTAADMLLTEGKKDLAVALYDTLLDADLAKHHHIAALHGAIRGRGSDGLKLLVEQLRADDPDHFQVALRLAHEMDGSKVTRALVGELPKLQPQPAKLPKSLVVTKAQYGAEDTWVDVTDQLAAAVTNNRLAIQAGNDLAGDPIHGVPNQLRVEYTLDGHPHTASIAEGKSLEIQCALPQNVRQALLIYVLGARGDRAAIPAVLELAKEGAAASRLAAVRALANLGDASAVPVLLEIAVESHGELAQAARDGLAELASERIDAALAAELARSEGPRCLVLIDLVGRRGIDAAVPTLLTLADENDEKVCVAAIGALGLTVQPDQLSALTDRLVHSESPIIAAAAKQALNRACLRMPDRDACAAELIQRVPTASTRAHVDLLELLGVVGGAKALEEVSAAANDADEEVQDAATRVLGGWMSPDAALVLLELAKTGNSKFKIRTLRGYIRIARQLDVPLDQRMAMCRQAMQAAERDAEKKLVLEVLGRNPSAESLSVVVPYLKSTALKEAACSAAVAIAEKIAKSHPAAVADAMRQVRDATSDSELANQAKRILRRAGK